MRAAPRDEFSVTRHFIASLHDDCVFRLFKSGKMKRRIIVEGVNSSSRDL